MIIKLIKSLNGLTKIQYANARSLKLKKIGDTVEVDGQNSSIIGRINLIRHLIEVESK